MSEAEKKPAEGASESAPAKKGPPTKVIAIVAVLMIVEAAGVFGIAKMTAPKAVEANVHKIEGADQTDHEATAEVPLFKDKLQNLQTGRVWIWDTELVLKVKAKNEEFVKKTLEKRAAEVQEGIATIFKRAQHSQLKEPGLETLNRQLISYMNTVLGKDGEGESRIDRILIPVCRGFPAD